nr:hypothetical protein [Cyclobacteriaceae bacterium]
SQAQIISTFDADADGWTFLNSATTLTPSHAASGGNPAGFISVTYSANVSFSTQNWIAPAKFLGSHVVRSMCTPPLSVNTTYHVSLVDTFCESVPVAVTAIISFTPPQPVITSSITPVGNALTICAAASLTLSAPNGFATYLWSNGAITQQITVSASGTYSVTVTNADGCSSPASDGLTITALPNPCSNTAPVISNAPISTTLGNAV